MAIMSENETIQHKFKKDSYVRARGGNSEFLTSTVVSARLT